MHRSTDQSKHDGGGVVQPGGAALGSSATRARCSSRKLLLPALLCLSLMGAAAAQTEPPLTPDSAPEIKAGTAVQLPGTSGELKAPEEPIGKAKPSLVKPGNTNPIAGAMAPSIPESATGKPALETPSPAPTSPANEPSVLPPTNVPFVAEPPAAEAEVPLKLPDIGPGSMSQPLLSGSQVDEPILELQPVPVMELSLFFGAVLLLAIGYLSFTARYTEPEDSPGNTPKSSLPR